MIILGEEDDAKAIPGTVKVSASTSDEGIISKQITYERSDVSEYTANVLELYKVQKLIAKYVDESGKLRVAGSPDYPLSLDYTIGEGVCSVTLKGSDVAPDAFFND